ncbi:MAG: O-antigen ligase family protein [Thermodesulfobacteriota bacterium]
MAKTLKSITATVPPAWVRSKSGRTLAPTQGEALSRSTQFLFLIFVAYTACPIIEVPGLDLSLSALILLFIAIEIFLSGSFGWVQQYSGWIILAGFFWLGILLSLVGNIFLGEGAAFDLDNWKQVLRYAYWMVAFVTTIYVVSTARMGPRVVKAITWAILITALFRWGEAVLFGKVGAWTMGGLFALTQNMYGILFSTYAPCLLVPLVSREGRRWPAILAALIVWGAVAINGSRSSWIAVSLGIFVFMGLYAVAQPARMQRLLPLILLPVVLCGLLWLAPQVYTEKVAERFDTFHHLEQDKSYNIRKLMIQKGWRMFLDSPLFGAGAGNFRKEMVKLDIDKGTLSGSQKHFNKKSSHNSYIALLGETGLAGCLPFGILLLLLVVKGHKAAMILSRQEETWALGIYVGFLMMSLHLWALSGLTGTGTWVMYGIVAALISSARKDSDDMQTIPQSIARRAKK